MKNELLAKYILGEANTKEEQKVRQWLEESEDHHRECQQIKRRIELGSKRYKYGFVANAPYDQLIDHRLVGVNSLIIQQFVKLTGIEVSYDEYKSNADLMKSFNENKLDYASLLYESDPNINLVENYLRDGRLFAYFEKQIPVAFIAVKEINDTTLEIKNLLTLENNRGRGYGKSLLQYIEELYQNKTTFFECLLAILFFFTI